MHIIKCLCKLQLWDIRMQAHTTFSSQQKHWNSILGLTALIPHAKPMQLQLQYHSCPKLATINQQYRAHSVQYMKLRLTFCIYMYQNRWLFSLQNMNTNILSSIFKKWSFQVLAPALSDCPFKQDLCMVFLKFLKLTSHAQQFAGISSTTGKQHASQKEVWDSHSKYLMHLTFKSRTVQSMQGSWHF